VLFVVSFYAQEHSLTNYYKFRATLNAQCTWFKIKRPRPKVQDQNSKTNTTSQFYLYKIEIPNKRTEHNKKFPDFQQQYG